MAALDKINEMMGPGVEWQDRSEMQEYFLRKILPTCKNDIGAYLIKGMDAIASKDPIEINAFLGKIGAVKNLGIIMKDELAIVASLKLDLEWACQMQKTLIETGDGIYEGVKVPGNEVKFFKSTYEGVDFTIARVQTRSLGDAYFAIPGKQLDIGLLEVVNRIFLDMEPDDRYGGLQFPAVHLNLFSAMHWLAGMEAVSGIERIPIAKPFQYINLDFSDKGIIEPLPMEEEAMRKPDLTIAEPFIFWGGGYTLKKPLFAACLAENSWIRKI